jgi:hypothetical protein
MEKLDTSLTNVPIPNKKIMTMKKLTIRKTIKWEKPKTKRRRPFTPKRTIFHLKKVNMNVKTSIYGYINPR